MFQQNMKKLFLLWADYPVGIWQWRHVHLYTSEVPDIPEESLHSRFLRGVCNVARACLQLVTHLLHRDPILLAGDKSESWLCLWKLITPSHLLKMSRPSWVIHLRVWLLPPLLFLLLLQPPPGRKQRNSLGVAQGCGIWSLTNLQKHQLSQTYLWNKEIEACYS